VPEPEPKPEPKPELKPEPKPEPEPEPSPEPSRRTRGCTGPWGAQWRAALSPTPTRMPADEATQISAIQGVLGEVAPWVET